jgi:hypothetical protein
MTTETTATSLRDKIMALPARHVYEGHGHQSVYAEGHRDARHAAAELASEYEASQDALVEQLVEALRPFTSATLTHNGHVIGLMREDFERARAALAAAQTGER